MLTIIIPNIKTGKYKIPNIKYDECFIFPENNKTCFQRIKFAKNMVKKLQSKNLLLITNCDFILREINNCIMLSYDFNEKDEFMAKHKYTKKHCLLPNKVNAYYCTNKKIKENRINKYGVMNNEICNTINNANEISDFLSDKIEQLEITEYGVDIQPIDSIIDELNKRFEKLGQSILKKKEIGIIYLD